MATALALSYLAALVMTRAWWRERQRRRRIETLAAALLREKHQRETGARAHLNEVLDHHRLMLELRTNLTRAEGDVLGRRAS